MVKKLVYKRPQRLRSTKRNGKKKTYFPYCAPTLFRSVYKGQCDVITSQKRCSLWSK